MCSHVWCLIPVDIFSPLPTCRRYRHDDYFIRPLWCRLWYAHIRCEAWNKYGLQKAHWSGSGFRGSIITISIMSSMLKLTVVASVSGLLISDL